MKISTNQFLEQLEQTGQYELADQLCQQFINNMKMLNPNRNDLAGSDWLSIMLNDYYVNTTEDGIDLLPISGEKQIYMFTQRKHRSL